MRKYKKNTKKHKRRSHRHTSKSRKYYKKKITPNLFNFKIPILYSGGDGSTDKSGTPTTLNSVYVPYKDGGAMQNASTSLQATTLQTKAYET
jgi:hypothetical protein